MEETSKFLDLPTLEHSFDSKVESGMFDRDKEKELLKNNPKLAEDKKLVEAAIRGALNEMESSFDIIESMKKIPFGSVIEHQGEYYMKAPRHNGEDYEPIKVAKYQAYYVNALEKTVLKFKKEWTAAQYRYDNITFSEYLSLFKQRFVNEIILYKHKIALKFYTVKHKLTFWRN